MDLSALLTDPDPTHTLPRKAANTTSRQDPDYRAPVLGTANDGRDLDEIVWKTTSSFVDSLAAKIKSGAAVAPPKVMPAAAGGDTQEGENALTLHFPIKNAARSVGARLSGEIARRMAVAGFPEGSVTLHFHGVAGQSFGAFCNKGMRLILRGEAHDYVGKSMHGGSIIISPQATPTTSAEGTAAKAGAASSTSHSSLAAAVRPGSLLDWPIPGPRESVIAGGHGRSMLYTVFHLPVTYYTTHHILLTYTSLSPRPLPHCAQATRCSTEPRAASCLRRDAWGSASPSATAAPRRWWRGPATTRAST